MLATYICSAASQVYAQEAPPYQWIEGHWVGNGFGGSSEELWSPPDRDGKMMGMYRHYKADGSLNFYEFLILDSAGMHLKHFTPSFHGWENKDEFLTFKKINYTDSTIELKSLRFELISPTEMKIYLRMKGDHTEVFDMRRKE